MTRQVLRRKSWARSSQKRVRNDRLEGKAAIVSGGGSGQERSHGLALAREGADLVVYDTEYGYERRLPRQQPE